MFVLCIPPVATFAAYWLAKTGLKITSRGRDEVSSAKMIAPALAGSLLAIPAFLSSFEVYDITILSLFGALLLIAAVIDRETGWAPDLLMLPLTSLAFLAGGVMGAFNISPFILGAAGPAIYIALNVSWIIIGHYTNAPIPPPADLLAMTAPAIVLGLNYSSACTYLVLAAILLLVMISPVTGRLARKESVIDTISEGGGYTDQELSSSYMMLALIFPVTFTALLVVILLSM